MRSSLVLAGMALALITLLPGALTAHAADDVEGAAARYPIHMNWDADIKPGGEEAFKTLAKKWAEIAAKDPGTLYSSWTITEDGKSARLNSIFADAPTAAAQFPANLWHGLDVLIAEEKIVPTGMVMGGKRHDALKFLMEFGTNFMVPVTELTGKPQSNDRKEGKVSDAIHVTWTADIKPDQDDGFRALATKWAEIAANDPDTRYSSWTIGEDGKSVRLDALYADAAATMAQFGANLWGELDTYLTPIRMVVCGKLDSKLEFLRGHGAIFMVPIED